MSVEAMSEQQQPQQEQHQTKKMSDILSTEEDKQNGTSHNHQSSSSATANTTTTTNNNASSSTTAASTSSSATTPSSSSSADPPLYYRTVVVQSGSTSTTFNVERRYVPKEVVGTGAYAVVCSAWDLKGDGMCCIKRIDSCGKHRAVGRNTLRELIFLRHFHGHDNILGLQRVMRPRNRNFDDVYVVLDLMDMTLDYVIRSPQQLLNQHVQYFMYQILRGLKYIHSAEVTHCDLKPQNMLVNTRCDLKICDFGLARYRECSDPSAMFTLWYRAPEIILRKRNYTQAADMWAVGCVLGELLCRKALLPGEDEINQLHLIRSFLGLDTSKAWDASWINKSVHSTLAHQKPATPPAELAAQPNVTATEYLPDPTKSAVWKNMQRRLPEVNQQALDLLVKLLTFEPKHRLTAVQALAHPYFSDLHCEEDEPNCSTPPTPDEFTFEDPKLSKEALRARLLQEIIDHNPPDLEIYDDRPLPPAAQAAINAHSKPKRTH